MTFDEVATWQAAREVRPVPPELAELPSVRAFRIAGAAGVVAFVATLPLWASESRVNLASLVAVFSIVGVSLVICTGWAGQVSLGQVAFVGIGAAVGGALTARQHLDLGIAVLGAGVAGAAVAAIIGFPALRRRGLTLAVCTLGLALVVPSWLPASRIARPSLFGVIDTTSETTFYFVSVGALALAIAAAIGVRRSRTGRVLIAARENERAARAFGVHTLRSSLAAFAMSGFFAAAAGALYVHHQSGLSPSAYAPRESLQVFSMVVIGGLGSISGVVLGAVYVRGANHFLPGAWQLLASGGGLLVVLWILPGGLGAALYEVRDAALRRIAARRGLVVPSLVADVRVDEQITVPPAATG